MTVSNQLKVVDHRNSALQIAHNLLNHRLECHYSELSNRWDWHNSPKPSFPFFGDCSSTFSAICFWAGIIDPNDLDYRGGDTGTLLAHAQTAKLIIPQSKVLPVDGVLLGWKDGQPEHVAMALQPGTVADPLFFNMGSSTDPSMQLLSTLRGIGKPITFFRVKTDTTVEVH